VRSEECGCEADKPGVPRMRDFGVFKHLIIMHLIYANLTLRGNPGLPAQKNNFYV
jgi:hypothetical protein